MFFFTPLYGEFTSADTPPPPHSQIYSAADSSLICDVSFLCKSRWTVGWLVGEGINPGSQVCPALCVCVRLLMGSWRISVVWQGSLGLWTAGCVMDRPLFVHQLPLLWLPENVSTICTLPHRSLFGCFTELQQSQKNTDFLFFVLCTLDKTSSAIQ